MTTSGSVLIATELACPLLRIFLWEALQARTNAAGKPHEVFTERMAREAFPEKHALQVWMASKTDAQQVEDLAFLEAIRYSETATSNYWGSRPGEPVPTMRSMPQPLGMEPRACCTDRTLHCCKTRTDKSRIRIP